MKLLTLLFLFFSITSYSQTATFSDNLKIIKNGLCEEENKECLRKITKYFIACESVGNYYAKKKNYKRAIYYYTMVSDINMDGHGFLGLQILEPNALRIYKKIIEKIGDINYYGLGRKKDIPEAVSYYNIIPSPFDVEKRDLFSWRIFGDSLRLIYDSHKSNDSLFCYYVNPFFLLDYKIPAIIDDQLSKIDSKLLNDSSLKCLISISVPHLSEAVAGLSYQYLDMLTTPRISKYFNQYMAELNIDQLDFFKKNGIKFPSLTVSLVH